MIKLINFFLVLVLSLQATDVIEVNEYTQEVNLSKNLKYYLDKSKYWRVEDVSRLKNYFLVNQKSFLDLDFEDASVWIQFSLKNSSEKALKFYLTIPLPALDYVEFYFRSLHSGKWTSEVAGDTLPLNKWSEPSFFHPTFQIELPPKAIGTYFLNLKSTSYIRTPIYLQSFERKISYETSLKTIERIFYLIVFILVSFSLYFIFRYNEKIFFLFVISTLFYYLNVWIIQGMGYRILWPNSPDFQNRSQIFFLSISLMSSTILMKIIFFKSKFFTYILKNFLEAIMFSSLCLALLCVMGIKVQFRIYIFNFIFFALIFLSIFLFYKVSLKERKTPLYYFLLGVLSLFFFGVLNSLLAMGLLPYSAFSQYSLTLLSPIHFSIILYSLYLYAKQEYEQKLKEN